MMEKYSFGIGDRFGREGAAQLRAIQAINRDGFPVVPVWNKSNREHELTGTTQDSVRREADEAVKECGWTDGYYVDADHITMNSVDRFIEHSDFFTIDVAHFIGKAPDAGLKTDFLKRNAGVPLPRITADDPEYDLAGFTDSYLAAIQAVKELYEYIAVKKPGGFIAEISMDEVSEAQSPLDLWCLLKELKYLGVVPHTLAPKFTGLFPKGVDYEGDVDRFANEFDQDLTVMKMAADRLELDHVVKLSVHSGSDKFSIYPKIRELVGKHHSGIHIKTAGTTWLAEVEGLAKGGGDGLRIAKEVYRQGLLRYNELAAPYAAVLHIDVKKLPPAREVLGWNSGHFARTVIHDQLCREYNLHFRQLIHIAYKVAAEMGGEFRDALEFYRDPIEEQVYTNLYDRHLRRLFAGGL
jgi:hypothetical protein